MKITISWHNSNPDTIWNRLAAKLGREPTNEEAKAEVKAILERATVDMAGKGRLPFQRKR